MELGKRMLKKFIALTMAMVGTGIVIAQDAQFTQFYANKLYLAPSFAGATKQQRVSCIYRNQWVGIPGGFTTMACSYDHYFPTFNSGLGLFVMRDVAGSGKLGLTNIAAAYSYDFQLNEDWHIRPGLNFQYSMYGIDFYKLRFYDQVSTGNSTSFEDPPAHETIGAVDAATSILVYSPFIWAGTTVDHLFRPDESFYDNKAIIPVKISVFGGFQIVKRGRLLKPVNETLSLAYLLKLQGDDRQLDLGLYWNKVPLVLGIWYRGIPILNSDRGDAIAALVGIKLKGFNIGYSYDFTISNLINSTHGAHEISVTYEFQTNRKKKIHAIPCPEF